MLRSTIKRHIQHYGRDPNCVRVIVVHVVILDPLLCVLDFVLFMNTWKHSLANI